MTEPHPLALLGDTQFRMAPLDLAWEGKARDYLLPCAPPAWAQLQSTRGTVHICIINFAGANLD